MPTTTVQKTGIKYGTPVVLIYHTLYRGNNLLVQIDATKLIAPWNTMSESLILNAVKNKINNISDCQLNVSRAYYDKIVTYNDFVIGTGDFLFLIESVTSIKEDIIEKIQEVLLDLKLTSDSIMPTYYVETYGSNYKSEGMEMVSLPTMSVFLFHYYGDRSLLFKSSSYDIINARTMAKLKNAILANDVILPESVKIFSAERNYDITGKVVLGDEFAIEVYDESYKRTTDFDELLNNLYGFLNGLKVGDFYKVWVQTTTLKHLV